MALLRHSLALLAAVVAVPVGLLWLLVRPRDRSGLGQRLGAVPSSQSGALWIHGASVGEAAVVARVAQALLEAGEGVRVSSTSATGLGRLAQLLPDTPRALAPLDHPWPVARSLARARPRALVLIETELWPVWLAEAARRGIPVVVLSGRLSPKRWAGLSRIRWMLRPGLRSVVGVAARTDADAERFVALGVPPERVRVGGDLKRDAVLPEDVPSWARSLEGALLWIAASTHEGEEEIALDAHRRCLARGHGPVLVLAPRHPQRSDAVAALCVDAGLAVERRSQCREPRLAPGGVLLLDTVGELSSLYRLAHVVFVGGSLVPVGGHDPWLPLRAGCALLLGPHQEEQPEAQSQLVAADPSMCVRDAASLSSALCDRLAEPRGSRMEKVLAELPRPGSALALQLGWLSEWIG